MYIGIDPSLTKTGIAIIDIEKKKILLDYCSPKVEEEKILNTYKKTVIKANQISRKILYMINNYGNEKTNVIFEEPMLFSQKASVLGILSGVIINSLLNNEKTLNIYTLSPNAIYSLNRGSFVYNLKTDNKKTKSKLVVQDLLSIFKNIGWSVDVLSNNKKKTRKISADEAEAFLMALLLAKDELNKVMIKNSILAIKDIIPNITHKYGINNV